MNKHLLTIAALFTPISITLAQIIVVPQALGTPSPTILQTANGVPQVDILTPSAAGVSRNSFQQFDIGQQGVILNNGRTASGTQLGGWVAANPWLAAGSAKVVLTEVHSTNPSLLQGYVEIAGSKAELIIANPAGIQCNGCGFINASRLQLATGTPQFVNGIFSGFAIGTGNIQINGAGMDASRVSLTEILTRETRINAGLWANHLRVTLAAPATTDITPAPVFALDVARLGGMYAGKIWLIGTEHGLGMRNAGVLTAMDELVVTVDGRLENRGSIMGDQIAIAAERLNNLGESGNSPVIAANTRLDIGTQELNNRDHALLFSAGEMAIGGALDADKHATGTAEKISNASATIEALGDMRIATKNYSNTNEGFTTVITKLAETQDQFYIQPEGAAEKMLSQYFRWEPWSRAGRYRWLTDKSQIDDGTLGVTPMPGVGEENCTGDLGSETCTPLANALYPRTDPVWQYFNLTPPDVEPTQAAYDNAQSAFTATHKNWADTTAARREALDQAISRYNAGFAATVINNWTQYQVRHTEFESEVSFSDPSRLAAGGKLTLQGSQFINDKSQIFVGDHINGTFDSLTNIDALGDHIVQERGTSQYTRSRWRGGFKRYHQRDWGPVLAYEPADVVTTFRLPVTKLIENQQSIPANTTSDATKNQLQSIIERELNAANSLFKVNPDNLGPLVETDPRFTQYRQWLGSDYMLSQMASDPTLAQKRLGDGFLEQKLVREQIAKLTGRRFLEGYASDEAEFAALMNSGLSYAKAWQLRPGIALSKEQVAQLSSDMVWLVEETVSVPGKDGQPPSLQKVLVPKIYLIPREGDLHANGTLIAADQIDLHLNGELNNSGSIAGRTVVRIAAEKINNLGGEIFADKVKLTATNDINNIGGSVHAESKLAIYAGRDLNIHSTTHSSRKDTLSNSITSAARTNLDRVASLYVSGVSDTNSSLVAAASRDINLKGAQINNAGDGSTVLLAGRDLNLGVVASSHRTASTDLRDSANTLRDSSTNEIGSELHVKDSITLLANRDINTQAASVVSNGGGIDINAGRDIVITAGESTRQTAQGTKIKTNGFLSSTTITMREEHDSSKAVESVLSGDTVHLNAGSDLQVKGSQIVSDKGTTLAAANNISLTSSTETTHDSSYHHKKSSGLLGGDGLSFTIGTRSTNTTQESDSSSAHGSTVGALQGNVAIKAGTHYQQSASKVIAPAGSVDIDASSIDITAATQTSDARWQSQTKQTGLTVAISNPIVSAVQTVSKLAQAAQDTKNSRAQALAVAAAALTVANTAKAAQTGAAPATSISASFSIGTSKSSTRSNQQTETAAPSVIAAGHDVSAQATSAAQDSKLSVHGSRIMAGNNATLRADGALLLDAQANTAIQTSSNHSSSASIGLSASMGAKGMQLGVTLAGSLGRGHADGDDLVWTNTQVSAGNAATLQSGSDTILQGAVVTAQRIDAQVGGNLQIQSLQDTSTYDSKQQNISGSATFGPATSGNLSTSQSKVDSTYASVNEQSGIKAGDGGFGVQVQGNTDLQGSVISSTEAAVQAQRNSFTSAELTTADVQNHASYSANATGISVGAGVSTDGKLAPSGSGVGMGHDSGSDSSVTTAGISGIAGNSAVRTGDKPTGIAKIFDAASVEKDINAQVVITQTFSREAPRAIATYADSQVKALQTQSRIETDSVKQAALQKDISHWEEGGTYRVALHAVAGGMAGGVGGAVGAGTAAAAAPLLNDLQTSLAEKLKAAGANEQVANAAAALITQTTAAGMGAVVSGGSAQAAAAALSTDANNRQLHQSEKDLIARKANENKVSAERLTKAACFKIKCWAQFPEGSPLYKQNYVSLTEAAGLTQEIAWVNQQKINGEFVHTPFQKLTDEIAATTRLSSVNGQGTFNGQFISKQSPPFVSNDCVTAECAAGMAPFRQSNRPDYISGQVSLYIFNGGIAINLHNGDVYGQLSLGRTYPGYSLKLGASVMFGNMIGGSSAQSTNEFLKGGAAQTAVILPVTPLVGVGAGLNHSYGGATALEYGVGTPGLNTSPAGYGFETKNQDKK